VHFLTLPAEVTVQVELGGLAVQQPRTDRGPMTRKLRPTIILSGGGDQADQVCARLMAKHLPKSKRLLFVPIAMRPWLSAPAEQHTAAQLPHSFGEFWDWAQALYESVAVRIDMWTDLEERKFSELEKYGAVLFGGGPTPSLAAEVQRTGFFPKLRRFVSRGGIYSGASSGAVLAGSDLRAYFRLRSGTPRPVQCDKGLGLVNLSIAVHHTPEKNGALAREARAFQRRILALADNSAVLIRGTHLTVNGEPATLAKEDGTL
jgi:peptidase E